MATTAETTEQRWARRAAFLNTLYIEGLRARGVDLIASLRELYAMGEISLRQFEDRVEVLLRSAR